MKIYVKSFILTILNIICFSVTLAFENADFIVSQDTSGDYTTIQDAINAAPSGATEPFIILIKKGTYPEKLYISKNNIVLVGEDRDSTIVVTAELRENWRETHSSDWGAATINISDGASGLVLANLTILNNYADVYPDDPGKNGHTMTIRGGGDRVIIICCNIIATGGDTCSLWAHGYYYHKDCYFEGYVDYVCPRGWCYIADCDFFGYNTGASIWHDGRENPDEKLVVRNSNFDGVFDFGLGRYHVDSQFYLLDCILSPSVHDNGGILFVGPDPIQWGHRVYYYNTHRETGDYEWHTDNLWEAANSPFPETVTARWTFQNAWDPETDMPAVLPFSYMPKPSNKKIRVDLNPELKWIPGRNAISNDIYFDTSNPPVFLENTDETVFEPGPLEPATIYYWRVDAVTPDTVIEGSVWQFKTKCDHLPVKAANPFPENNATDLSAPIKKLNWDMDLEETDTVKVYMGFAEDSLQLSNVYTVPGYDPGALKLGVTYYWRVDLMNHIGVTQGDVWNFTMEQSDYDYADYYQDEGENGIISIEAEDFSANTTVNDHQWVKVTETAGYSGSGAMQVLPDDGTYILTNYSVTSSRLDFTVNFIRSGTHYLWVRAYSIDTYDDVIHMGLDGEEVWEAFKIGNFQNRNQWEWINKAATVNADRRTIDIKALGIQAVNLWFGKDGALVDKIVITTNPDYVPTGLGPDQTVDVDFKNEHNNNLPKEFELYHNYPNPFNSSTILNYNLPSTCEVDLTIYDLLGRKIKTLVNSKQIAGKYSVQWIPVDSFGHQLATGIYYARLKASSNIKYIKMIFLK